MTYIDKIAAMIAKETGDEYTDFKSYDRDLYRIYAVLALTVGEEVTLENVHDAWSAWRAGSAPEHPSIVWFDDLVDGVQAMDQPYADAIATVAARIDENRP